MLLLLGLVLLVLNIGSIIWIYNEEDGGNAVLWAVLTFFFSAIALLIYGLMNRSRTALLLAAGIVGLAVLQGVTASMTAHAHPF